MIMRVTTLKHALKTGNLQIQPGTFVRRINHSNGRVVSVDCISGTSDPVEKTLPCPLLVVACECIESVRLLLASNAGNQDVLGHYFMVHTTGGGRSNQRHHDHGTGEGSYGHRREGNFHPG